MRITAFGTFGLLALLLLSGCRPIQSGSSLKNIYQLDESDQNRRHEASALEINWTIKAKGCSGVLLSPSLVMTANHCQLKEGSRLQSGWAVLTGSGSDLFVDSVLEASAALDYMIVSVKWTSPMPSSQTFPPYIATDSSEVFNSQVADLGDTIFTVGYPDDKAKIWKSTYAEGQIKYLKGQKMYFNIGVINGNSGGGILKKENSMLVGLAIGGTKAYQDEGWNKNSVDDSANWNFGTTTWAIYPTSDVLRKQFPQGKNIYFGETFFARTRLYLSIQETTEKNGTVLRVASNHEAETIVVCPKDVYPCKADTSGAEPLAFEIAGNGRKIYSRSKPYANNEMKKIGLVAFDRSGRLIGQRQVALETKP